MASNFEYLLANPLYKAFATAAIEAEKSIGSSPAQCAIMTRRAIEVGVKFVFAHDRDLTMPYNDQISTLIHDDTFRSLISPELFQMLKSAIYLGNKAVHTGRVIKRDEAVLGLRQLFELCDWIDCSYSPDYQPREFTEQLLPDGMEQERATKKIQELSEKLSSGDKKLAEMMQENEKLRQEMAAVRKSNAAKRPFRVDKATEAETRKQLIDVALNEAGWYEGSNYSIEVEVTGMPTPTGLGYVDYVLWGKDNKPLAVVEAKKSSVDPLVGSQQAKLYADCLEKQYGRRPLIFTTNGFEYYYTNDYMQEARRRVFSIFTQEELQLEIDRRKLRIPLTGIEIKDEITSRYYQKEAITACCEGIENHRRKLLIVQATGSGKTRVSISLVDVLLRHNYVKNVLFLADRTALVRQAKKNYVNLLPNLTCCNLLENKDDPEQCRMIFSTYPTMLNAIDEKKRKDGGKLFTPGHFDLIILDESHRSIYNRYKDIFAYFDAVLVGLTATPKDDIGKSTYEIFDLPNGVPTYYYSYEQAVADGYLVPYVLEAYKSPIIDNGIHYDELSEEDKAQYEETFADDPEVGENIESGAVNRWLFNKATIDNVLLTLLETGLKVSGGDRLGKTIIFARSSKHAAAIVQRFNILFPELGGNFIEQIDYSIKYSDSLLDEFSIKEKLPQIAVSVDMLDTGIDIPEILNLVFFKRVRSYAKFWQMIGRGTRLCEDLFGAGQDKQDFKILDFCGNFEFFRLHGSGRESAVQESITEKIFNVKVSILRELQSAEYTTQEEYVAFRKELADGMCQAVKAFNPDSFRVKQRARYVETYRDRRNWEDLGTVEVNELKKEIAPLVMPSAKENETARMFDYLLYSIILAVLNHSGFEQAQNTVRENCRQLTNKYSIPQVAAKRQVIERVLTDDFWAEATPWEYDEVREALRDLLQYLDKTRQKIYYTDFEDTVQRVAEDGPALPKPQPEYKERVEHYLREVQDNLAVFKLRNNKKLNQIDMDNLEHILWTELGTREEYETAFGDKPIGLLIRKIVGVEREAVNEAFSKFISDENLNTKQIDFVKKIIDYIVVNGNIEEPMKVFSNQPFKEYGAVLALFKGREATVKEIVERIAEIKDNSEKIA